MRPGFFRGSNGQVTKGSIVESIHCELDDSWGSTSRFERMVGWEVFLNVKSV